MQGSMRPNPSPNSQQIAAVAYSLWEQAGQPTGRDVEFWLKAEKQVGSQAAVATEKTGEQQAKRSSSAADATPTNSFDLKSQPRTENGGKPASRSATYPVPTQPKRTTPGQAPRPR